MEKDKFNQAEYIAEFRKRTYKYIGIQINRNTEQDLIEFLEAIPNKNEYIKELIRKDMNGKK